MSEAALLLIFGMGGAVLGTSAGLISAVRGLGDERVKIMDQSALLLVAPGRIQWRRKLSILVIGLGLNLALV
jgi:hypothetical protein